MLERLASDQSSVLLDIFQKAMDHHDPAKPEVTHDLSALSAQAGGGSSILSALLLSIISDPKILSGIFSFVVSKLHKAPAETVHNPATSTPTAPKITEPEPPAGAAGAVATSGPLAAKLEAWLEEGWHDWRKGPGDENPDGHFDPAAELAARPNVALPPAPVLRFMTGVQPGPGGHARVPRNEPGTVFPVVTHHFAYDTGESYAFDSSADPGVKQPVPELGHVQGGDIFQLSNGWDFILRVAGFHGDGPRVLTYHTEAPGYERSNDVVVPISRAKD